MLPPWLVRLVRRKALQPLHIRLHRAATVGMNYWGGAEVTTSGERWALKYAAAKLLDVQHPVVFDVGAHWGDFTQAVLSTFPKAVQVHAFEPSPTASKVFLDKVAGSSGVRLHRFGFGDSAGVATLHAPPGGSSIATMYANTFEMQGRELVTEHVELRTVDDFCREQGIERIHYLKVDTEGHELAVLRGARSMIEQGKVDFIQFEFGECHLDSRVFFRDVFAFLAPRYLIHRILPDGLWPLPTYTPDLEIFHTANYLAIIR